MYKERTKMEMNKIELSHFIKETKMDISLLKLSHFVKKRTTIEIQIKKVKGTKSNGNKHAARAMGINYQKQATARDAIVNRLRLKLLRRRKK